MKNEEKKRQAWFGWVKCTITVIYVSFSHMLRKHAAQSLAGLSLNASARTRGKFYLISKILTLVNSGSHSRFLLQDCFWLKS